ncbi:ATP-NAD kinase [Actinorhabdospora filicis]|uniref:ATP-NAD kinase n=1 Tax=Actinorhabdospora filicis TaxID=1785913 RepID=A0A9W6SGM7_9ACTN|nr:NAD(+)/NADH kinase [Actinorhabdospora filicis]GLZ75512.1 ATP-NAD kinase [Actinorhabdospora filicis]
MTPLGLIVNPVAGLGGTVGLKGSDGAQVQRLARERGAVPRAGTRAALAVAELAARCPDAEILTVAGDMGADAAGPRGRVVCERPETTGPADTRRAVDALVAAGAGLIMFAGGDGTARDVLDALGGRVPAIGIPAGVKMHSAVHAVNPRAAGEVAAAFLAGTAHVAPAEVADREGDAIVLYGLMPVPRLGERVQRGKVGSARTGGDDLAGIAAELAAHAVPGGLDVYGPGTTTHGVLRVLGVDTPPTGVTAVSGGRCLVADADAAALEGLAAGRPGVRVIVSPIGGQGFLFGRGNQQITPALLRGATVTVVCGEAKLAALGGRPLLVDTGDDALDASLTGYLPIVTGRGRRVMYKLGEP